MLIAVSEIIVEARIREDFGTEDEQAEFAESFKKLGQLQAITVEVADNGYRLLAGERRYRAIRAHHEAGTEIPNLKPGYIECTILPKSNEIAQKLKEYAENKERKDFTWQEEAKFIRSVHDTMVAKVGDGQKWTQDHTAVLLNISQTRISQYLRLDEAVKQDEVIAKASTMDAAVKRLKIRETMKVRHEDAQADTRAFSQASEIAKLGDARELIKSLPDNSVDFINFDPPWGEDASYKSQNAHEEWDDSSEYSDTLMRELFPELFRVLKPDRFCAFWHRSHATEQMAQLALSFGFNLRHTRTPCIWFKPDKVTDRIMAPDKQLIEAYETFYLLRKGDPVFHEKHTNNVFPFERVKGAVHPTEKPVDLMLAIIRLATVPGETILDPTAGSFACIDAAIRNSRKAMGWDLSEYNHKIGVTRLTEYLKTVRIV